MQQRSDDAKVRRFWDRYIALLQKQGVKAPFDRWHVRRAEAFIAVFPDRRLADLTADDVAGYLEQVGRDGALKPWQFNRWSMLYGICIALFAPNGRRASIGTIGMPLREPSAHSTQPRPGSTPP